MRAAKSFRFEREGKVFVVYREAIMGFSVTSNGSTVHTVIGDFYLGKTERETELLIDDLDNFGLPTASCT